MFPNGALTFYGLLRPTTRFLNLDRVYMSEMIANGMLKRKFTAETTMHLFSKLFYYIETICFPCPVGP